MMIERTFDTALIRSVVEHPEILPQIHDGAEQMAVPMHASIYYLAPKIEVGLDPGMIENHMVGVVAFIPVNSATWNPHIAILPQYRGRGTEVMRSGIAWMFENTACEKLVAYPPSFKVAMIRVFEKCGFRTEGMSPASFRWKGELHNRVLMGLEKGRA